MSWQGGIGPGLFRTVGSRARRRGSTACAFLEAVVAMTTLVELEAKLLAALVTEANFARAKSDLRLANLLRNGRGRLQDCAVFLDDDGTRALIYAHWHDDAKTVCASFELGQPTTEDAFNADEWAAKLMRGDFA
jgi:hypothetical protein